MKFSPEIIAITETKLQANKGFSFYAKRLHLHTSKLANIAGGVAFLKIYIELSNQMICTFLCLHVKIFGLKSVIQTKRASS